MIVYCGSPLLLRRSTKNYLTRLHKLYLVGGSDKVLEWFLLIIELL